MKSIRLGRWPTALLGSAIALLSTNAVLASPGAYADDGPFPVIESFSGGAPSNPNWKAGGAAKLISADGGWLELTPAAEGKNGSYILDEAFPSDEGIVASFDYNISGGGGKAAPGNKVKGGDGFSVFIIDGAQKPSVGSFGAALGYACLGKGATCAAKTPGVSGAYLGIGLDYYGNFSSQTVGTGKSPGQKVDSVVVRGSGSGAKGYEYVTGAKVPGGLPMKDGKTGRSVRVSIQGGKVSVGMAPAGSTEYTTVIPDTDLSKRKGQAPLPKTFKIGFAGGTGSAFEAHRIRNASVALPSNLVVKQTGPAKAAPGDDVEYTLTVNNVGPNDVDGATIADQVPAGITDVTWTCSATGGASCSSESGTGNDISLPVDLPKPGVVTIMVKGKVAAEASGKLENTATVTAPERYLDVDPATGSAKAATEITPKTAAASSMTYETTSEPGKSVTVTPKNSGPDATDKDGSFTVALPKGVIASELPEGCKASADNRSVTCTVPAGLKAGESGKPFTIPTTMAEGTPAGQDLTGGSVTGDQPGDPNAGKSTPLSFNSGDGNPGKPASSKSEMTYPVTSEPGKSLTVTPTNAGPDATDKDGSFTVALPKGVTAGDLPDGCKAAADGTSVTCTVPAGLKAGESAPPVSIPVKLAEGTPAGTKLTGGSVTGDQPGDPNAGKTTPIEFGSGEGNVAPKPEPKSEMTYPVTSEPGKSLTVTPTNKGPDATDKDGSFTVKLPDGATAGDLPDGCKAAADGTSVTCTVPAGLKAGESAPPVSIPVKLAEGTPAGKDLTGGSVTGNQPGDPNTGKGTPVTFNSGDGDPGKPTGPKGADIATKVTAGDTPVAPGEQFDYSVEVTNNGPDNASAAKVSAKLPKGLTLLGSDPNGCKVESTPIGELLGADGQVVTCPSLGAMKAGDSKTTTLKVALDPSYTGNGDDIKVTATAMSKTADPNEDNNASPPAGLPGGGKPAASKSDMSYPVTTEPGKSITVTATNNGPSTTTADGKVTVKVPAGTTATDAPEGCQVAADKKSVTCTVPKGLKPGDEIPVKIGVTDDPGTPANTPMTGGSASGEQPGDPTADNNTTPIDFNSGAGAKPVEPPKPMDADLETTLDAGDTPVAAGETFDYTVTVKNNGPVDAANVKPTASLSEGLTLQGSEPAGCKVDSDGKKTSQHVTCPAVASVKNGDSVTYKLKVKLDPAYAGNGSDIQALAAGRSDSPDANKANNTSKPAGLPGGKPAPAKSDLSYPITSEPGKSITVAVTNNGPSTTRGPATVKVTMPKGTTVASAPDACKIAADKASLTCTIPAGLQPGLKIPVKIGVKLGPGIAGDTALGGGKVDGSLPGDPSSDNNSTPITFNSGKGTGTTPPKPGGGADLTYKLTSDQSLESENLTITVTNNGPNALTQEGTILVTIPGNMGIDATFAKDCSGTSDEGTIQCKIPPGLDKGESYVYKDIPLNVYNEVDAGQTLIGGNVNMKVPGDPAVWNNSGPWSMHIDDVTCSWGTCNYKVKPIDTSGRKAFMSTRPMIAAVL